MASEMLRDMESAMLRSLKQRRVVRRAVRPSLGLLVAAAIVVALGACGGTSSQGGVTASDSVDTAPVAQGGTLRLARSIEPATLNPFYNVEGNGSLQTLVQIYDTLVQFEPGSTDAKPGLATSWDVSPDNKIFTFHLRDARFSDGTPVTSADVKYSLGRADTPTSAYYTLYGVIKDVEAPDPSTVVVRLKRSTIGFPWYLGFPAASIVSKRALEKLGDEAFSRHPVGSGAFMLKRWVKGQVVELVRNPYYWHRGQPYLDEVKLLYVPNDNTRTLDLMSGNVDAVDAVPFSQVDQVNNSGQARVLFQLSSGMYSVWFNERYKPLDEQGVRQALNYATPLREIQQVVFGGRAEIANANMPKLKDWSPGVKPYPYDIAKARALLARSAKPHGFDLTIDLVGGDDTSKQVAQILQDSWGKIGVNVKLHQYDLGSLWSRVFASQYQAYMVLPDVFTSDLPIQDEFAKSLYANYDSDFHNGFTWYNNKEAARLATQAINASDESEQAELFAKLQQVGMDDPPAVSLIFPPYRAAARNNVHGYQYVQTGWWRLEQVSLER
jgi:peptide/nickel transport system substrate-binding protein